MQSGQLRYYSGPSAELAQDPAGAAIPDVGSVKAISGKGDFSKAYVIQIVWQKIQI